MTNKYSTGQAVPTKYQDLFRDLLKAESFEELRSILRKEISRSDPDSRKELYNFLSENKNIVEAIAKYQDYEKFKSTLWTLVYKEPSDLTELSLSQSLGLRFSKETSSDPNHALAVIDNSHYPVVLDLVHYPSIIDNTHCPMVKSCQKK